MPTDIINTPDELFELFVNAQTFKTILHSFDDLCRILRIDRQFIGYGKRSLYKTLTSKLTSWKCKSLWAKIDKRGSQKEYENGNVCADIKVKRNTHIHSLLFLKKYSFNPDKSKNIFSYLDLLLEENFCKRA
jgi:hypothetical protein